MSRSAIYVANSTTQTVAENGLINPGTVIRRFGCNVHLSGSAINLNGTGYYSINSSFTVAPTAEGEVTISVFKDGVAVPGATASQTAAAAGDLVNLSISALVREYCPCADDSSNITFVLSDGAASVTNSAIVVEKL